MQQPDIGNAARQAVEVTEVFAVPLPDADAGDRQHIGRAVVGAAHGQARLVRMAHAAGPQRRPDLLAKWPIFGYFGAVPDDCNTPRPAGATRLGRDLARKF